MSAHWLLRFRPGGLKLCFQIPLKLPVMPEAYSESVVIFLDVLGTRERDTFEKRYAVHQVFHTEARVHEARHRQLRQPIYERTVRSFSDCAFFIYRYKADI